MYCENCGKLIEEGNKFCPYCGTKLVGTEEKVEEEISHEIRTDKIPEQEIPKRNTMQDNMEEKQVNQRESTEEKNVQENIRVKASPVTPLLQADALAKLAFLHSANATFRKTFKFNGDKSFRTRFASSLKITSRRQCS